MNGTCNCTAGWTVRTITVSKHLFSYYIKLCFVSRVTSVTKNVPLIHMDTAVHRNAWTACTVQRVITWQAFVNVCLVTQENGKVTWFYYGDTASAKCQFMNCQSRMKTGYSSFKLDFYLSSCQDLCKKGTYGLKCSKICACQNNATCSPFDGFCNCTSGFTGVHCEKQCTGSTGGQDCKTECNCTQWGTCNPFTGVCV